MNATPLFDQAIPSDLTLVSGLVASVADKLAPVVLDETVIFNLKLCLHEAVVNAVNHGNKADRGLKVRVLVTLDGKELSLEVTDQGQGFDFRALPDPTTEENIGKYHGRGIYLMMSMMDRVTFSNEGRTVKMVKVIT